MTYTALTIGPIYKTMSRMKKVREIWGASYIFSRFMRLIIKELIDNQKVNKDDFLVPHIDEDLLENDNIKYKGIGFFHDRLIFSGDDGLTLLNNAIGEALNIIAGDIKSDSFSKVDDATIKSFLKQYLLYYAIELELEDDKNPIKEISPYLDTLELRARVEPKNDTKNPNYLIEYLLEHGETLRYDADHIKEEDGGCKKKSFPSIPQITINDFVRDHEKRSEIIKIFQEECAKESSNEDVFERLEDELRIKLKPYHKYIAIVQADGDNMGREIEQSFQKDKVNGLKEFSENLIEFSKEASVDIVKYGGHPVYIGGDDLLFFAPIYTQLEEDKKNVTIFDLVKELDAKFKEQFKDSKADPSLSFGISITYYKYPMVEALENSYDLLINRAKNIGKSKDAISVQMIKHSGQSFTFSLSKKLKSYKLFRELLKENLKENIKLPHSLHHKLSTLDATIRTLLDRGDSLVNFFKNFFDEDVHKTNFKNGLERVRELLVQIHKELTPEQIKLLNLQDSDADIQTPALYILFSLLSTIKLLRGDE